MAKNITTILEITETHIKIAQAKTDVKPAVITKIIIEDIITKNDEAISRRLGEIIKKANIKPLNLIVVIPRSLVTIRNVSLPSVDESEIAKMVELQSVRQIPYAKEDVIVDYSVVGRDESGYSKVLLVIAHKDVINRYRKIVRDAAISPSLFAFSSQGVCNAYSEYLAKAGQSDKEATMILDIDSVNTDICFVRDNKLLFSRSIPFGRRESDSEHLPNLLRQIQLTISTYKKESIGPDISKIAVVGLSDDVKHIAAKLESEFNIYTEVLDLSKIVAFQGRMSLPVKLTQGEVSAAVIYGLLNAKKEILIDLLPADIQKEQRGEFKKKELILAGIYFLAAVISLSMVIFVQLHKKERYIDELKASLKDTSPEAKNISLMTQKLELIKQRLANSATSIDVLYEIYDLMPQDMSLSAFAIDEQKNLSLQGVALAMSDVFNFQSALGKSEFFSGVEVKYASTRRARSGEITDFRITCKIKK